MPTSPTAPTALPTAPSTTDPANFDVRADAFFAALPLNQTQVNALSTNVYNNAVEGAASAVSAASSAAGVSTNATLAAQYAGATVFVPGSTYAQYDVRYSSSNQRSYRKITAGSATLSTDPAADATNWKIINIARPVVTVSTSTMTALAGFDYLLTFAGVVTVTSMASPAVDDTFGILVANGRADNVLNPNGNTIHGIAGNLTIDDAYASVVCRFLNSTYRVSKAS